MLLMATTWFGDLSAATPPRPSTWFRDPFVAAPHRPHLRVVPLLVDKVVGDIGFTFYFVVLLVVLLLLVRIDVSQIKAF
jgi:hypothetical protein